MDEKKTDVGTRERADVDDVGQDTTRGERGLGMEEMPAEITFDIVEEAFVPLDEGMEPDRRELVAGRVEAEYAKVNGFSAVTQAKRALINGMSTVTIGEKAKVTGFSPVVVTSQKATVKKGAAVLAVAGHEVKLKDHGYVGIALAPRIQVDEGGRVLITPMVALLIGLAFGVGFGAMALMGVWVFRRGMGMLRRRSWQRRMMRGYRDVSGTVRESLSDYADKARSLYHERMRAM